jgi:antirestriction protein
MTIEMQVWVGCLACYNAGNLNGKWLDAADATDWKCSNPTHEEFWVFDLENMPVREEMSPSTAQAWAELVEDIDSDDEYEAFRAWLENDHKSDPGDVDLSSFRDAYFGTWESERAYAENYADEIIGVDDDPAWPFNHVDWDSATDDLMQGYWSAKVTNGVAIFSYV